MKTIEKQIRKYVDENIKPTQDENNEVSEHYSEISHLLEKHGYYTFRTWSYARWTAISPVNDLDIICESDNQDIADFMNWEKWEWLYRILSEKYWEDNIDFQSHSIGITFPDNEGDFSIDVVIAQKIEELNEFGSNLYIVPTFLYKTKAQRIEIYKNIKENWGDINLKKSDPKWYKKQMKEIKDGNDSIIYATRLLKKWKCWIKESYYMENERFLKSFHLEEILKKQAVSDTNLDILWLLNAWITNANLSFANIPDRADKDVMIDWYIDDENFDNNRAWKHLLSLGDELWMITESNVEEIISKILLIKKVEKQVSIGNKQKSYYAIN